MARIAFFKYELLLCDRNVTTALRMRFIEYNVQCTRWKHANNKDEAFEL